MRGDKGSLVLNAVHWGFQHRERVDVFSDVPPAMKTSFQVLRQSALDVKFWAEYCKEIKPEK